MRRRTRRAWTPAEDRRLVELASRPGATVPQVAADLGRLRVCTRRRARRLGCFDAMRMRLPRYTYDAQIKALIIAGRTAPEITADLGVYNSAVYSVARRHNLRLATAVHHQPNGPCWTKAESETLVQLAGKGWQVPEIAQHMGRSQNTIRDRADRLNLGDRVRMYQRRRKYDRAVRELAALGLNTQQVGYFIGVNAALVWRVARRIGVIFANKSPAGPIRPPSEWVLTDEQERLLDDWLSHRAQTMPFGAHTRPAPRPLWRG